MTFLEVDLSNLDLSNNYYDQIYNSEIDGLIVKNALSQFDIDVLKPEKIEQYGVLKEGSDFGYVIGRTLNGCAELDLDHSYFDETDRMRGYLDELFSTDYVFFLEQILSRLCGKRKVALPRNANGRLYKPSTVRVLQQNTSNGMPPHIGQEFLSLPQLSDLSNQADVNSQLSFFFMLQPPDVGGELEVYDLVWNDTPKELVGGMNVIEKKKERENLLMDKDSKRLALEKGDLLLFDGGRIWHQVRPVLGQTNRVTIGGFTALSKNHRKVFYWH